MLRIELLIDAGAALGEGPLWDVAEQRLYWIDGWGMKVHRCDAGGGGLVSHDVPSEVGAIIPRTDGGTILALRDGLYGFDFESGAMGKIIDPDPGHGRIHINDGKVDRQGRLIIGYTDDEETDPLARVFRFDADLTVHQLDEGYICVNGPCWSLDGRTLYLADSPLRTIFAYDYDIASGGVSNRRVFADFETLGISGFPDGATVDAEGCVWSVRLFGGGLVRLTPDGAVDRTLGLPVESPTSIGFGGPDLDILYVTSMSQPWGDWAPREPEAGGLFAIHDLGVRGVEELQFAG